MTLGFEKFSGFGNKWVRILAWGRGEIPGDLPPDGLRFHEKRTNVNLSNKWTKHMKGNAGTMTVRPSEMKRARAERSPNPSPGGFDELEPFLLTLAQKNGGRALVDVLRTAWTGSISDVRSAAHAACASAWAQITNKRILEEVVFGNDWESRRRSHGTNLDLPFTRGRVRLLLSGDEDSELGEECSDSADSAYMESGHRVVIGNTEWSDSLSIVGGECVNDGIAMWDCRCTRELKLLLFVNQAGVYKLRLTSIEYCNCLMGLDDKPYVGPEGLEVEIGIYFVAGLRCRRSAGVQIGGGGASSDDTDSSGSSAGAGF